MDIGNLAGKAQEALKTAQGQKVAGEGLNRAAAAADSATGNKHTDHINKAKDAVADKLGLGSNGQEQPKR